ncbi:MAG TPA: DEAD/DEAH box helicase [Clostridiaceae bacterium]|jgi:ATP-dependent RNA helicase DeaD|nr:DEAD/DEAH box helicase [Clostridiaceae bacterium]
MEIKSFEEIKPSNEILKALAEMEISEPTSIQKKALPLMMEGYNLIAKAPTGTGKTLAFGIPILEYLDMKRDDVQALILCPTRELAMQIADVLTRLGRHIKGLKILALIGGQRMDQQLRKLQGNPQIVVATPGRLLDHLQRKTINISGIMTLILDEADEMLNMGFIKDIRKIMSYTPKEKQIALFSATMSREVMNISWEYIQRAVEVDVAPKAADLPPIDQYIVRIEDREKDNALIAILKDKPMAKVMVFCNTKNRVRRVTDRLRREGIAVDCLHGDIQQSARNRIMDQFRKGAFRVLVATDVAARGIDVADVDGVFNFEVPLENEYYLHRIGRTGRAKQEGEAFTFVSFTESVRMDDIVRYLNAELTEYDYKKDAQ